MHTLLQDLRFGARMLLKKPVFTLVAVLTLALGIGANTAVFSLVNKAMLRPLPVADPAQLVALGNAGSNRMFQTFSYPNYKDLRDRNQSFAGLIAYRFAPLSLSHDGVNERLWGYVVTGNYFDVLGVKPALGRVISTDDDRTPGAHPVAVVSHKSWQTRFGGAPDIVGKNVIVNGRGFTIIGVAPPGFSGTEVVAAPEMWFPMAMQAAIEVGNDWLEKRGVENIFIQGRLKDGVSIDRAQAELNAIAAELEREFPEINEGKRITLARAGASGGLMRGAAVGFVGLLMGVVALVLLLACVNLANLLLARSAERRGEVAVRLALGASRWRVIRQLLTESVLLSAAGGVLGLLLAAWLVDLAAVVTPPVDVPLSTELPIDRRVLAFTCLVSLATGVLFGLLPAWQATKTDLVSVMKGADSAGGRHRSRLKSGLIVAQVALSLVLLVGGGLMLRALERAQTLDLGFDPKNAVELSFDLRLQGYDDARGREFQKRLLERVRALTGVRAAGLADLVPVDLHFGSTPVFVEGRARERAANTPRALTNRVSPGYFAAMSTRLVAGRDFSEQDNETAPRVVIVNQTFARRFWPGEDAIGKRFSVGSAEAPQMEVIGVAADGKYAGLNETPKPFVFRPLWQSYTGTTSLVVRAESATGAAAPGAASTGAASTDTASRSSASAAPPELQRLIAEVRRELQQLDATLPLSSAKTMEERLSLPLLPARVAAALLGSFGLLALILAAIGLYGVMSYAVVNRTREIGVRVALGAGPRDILGLVLGEGMMLVLAGVGIGLVAALGLTRLMTNLLFGVSATDPLTFAGVAVMLVGVALAACWIPARRAAKVEPMVALRYE